MPYKSEAQRRYFHANKEELEKQGVDVGQWDRESKGKKLPEKAAREKNERGDSKKRKRQKNSSQIKIYASRARRK